MIEMFKTKNMRSNQKVKTKIIKSNDISDTFGKLKRKLSGQKFKKKATIGW